MDEKRLRAEHLLNAEEAEKMARQAPDEAIRKAWLDIARNWRKLAGEPTAH
jgi:hypothetical protein